mmetsp:Transcript_44996/g.103843  ORF Transcript_44996/g.103843 Transcript_44996/m.103843 type:complete len:225 (+) Transcript_44996:2503-3177(+)
MSPIRLSSPQSNVDIGASSPFRWKARRRGSTGHSILCTIGAPEPVATLTLIAAVPPKSAVTSQAGTRIVSPEALRSIFTLPSPTPSPTQEAVSGSPLPPHALPHLSFTLKRSSGVLPPSTRVSCGTPSEGATSTCGAPGPSDFRVTPSCFVPADSTTLMLSVSSGCGSNSLKPDVSSKPTRCSAVTVVAPHRSASRGSSSSDAGTAGQSSKRPGLTVTATLVPP